MGYQWATTMRPFVMLMPRIITDPEIIGGKAVIAGMRISVALILERLAEGRAVDDILAEYPQLTRQQVVAAIEWARARVECADAAE